MKISKLFLQFIFSLAGIFVIVHFNSLHAQTIEKIAVIDQVQRFGMKEIPADIKNHIVDYYRNIDNKDGLPYVELKNDNTGTIQVHNYKEYPIEFWLETDEKGEILIQRGVDNPNYIVVIIARYLNSSKTANDPEFQRIAVAMDIVNKKAIIFGERAKNL